MKPTISFFNFKKDSPGSTFFIVPVSRISSTILLLLRLLLQFLRDPQLLMILVCLQATWDSTHLRLPQIVAETRRFFNIEHHMN